ncbi:MULTISPECIES: TRAP transporter large permease [Halocynthiibacter]|uniref:TRAP transporter large permease protein n=1 Tax=Halocynthiibacter halioticoli TaxID=2986804 RepID=A0AAE3IYT1_9RHOB|nr:MULTISPECIES: TRAP transporter large permease [Halocynthiibacter]MCV6823431.1 TRAP transporter large permease [Halocynthiibacter halioticoli]MCW4056432.1 TRAP transporter large permease [Halocynthiibacter sp. SDUM655004]MDE0590602.1 TRAP transporter large permease [Halocynthiibacter sp. C4]
MTLVLLFVILFFLLIAGAPVAVALGVSSLVFVLLDGLPPVVVLHNMVNGINSFPLIAVPFFIMAGHLMNTAGITTKIFAFARAGVGWMYGGLGHVNVGASVVFAGMSGAAVADAGGLGNIEIKAMREAGYDTDFSVGITAASSTIGPIIPPSLPLVVYGVIADTSIGQLFAAGLIPGMLMAFSLMVMVGFYAKVRNYPRDERFSISVFARAFVQAIFPLFTPIIIVGGILFGIFTPTEAAIAAVVYSMFLGLVVYRTLTFKRILRVSMDTVETTASIMMIVAASTIFAWILTANQVAQMFATELLGFTENKTAILLIMMLVVLIVGCFMETIAAITILTPVLLPVAITVGVDPVHFGIILILNLMIGLLTPPVGMVLYVLAKVSDVPFERCVVATAPFLIPLVAVLLMLTFIPSLSMWLPTTLYR